ncbi:MAG: hypothetical protein FRX49_12546 [Trebouxia sp. A1-2]|nr:MAG: hypothetical protein FRX49_12546 [Trebouxia sp. A1-2]
MGICGSTPAVKQAAKPAPTQNGHVNAKPQVSVSRQQEATPHVVTTEPQVVQEAPAISQQVEPVMMQDMPQGQALSDEPILANEHIRVSFPQAGGDFGRTSVTPVPRLVSEAPPGVLSQIPSEMPYAAPFIPPPSLPPPEASHQDTAPAWQARRKKAVLIGCNYLSIPQAALKGCVRDARCLYQLLTVHYGFQADSVIFLHDEQPHAEYLPTKANILAAVAWLVTDCQPSDSLFFSFSGHGCQPPHPTGGSWDEGILPSDFQQAGPLTDDELHAAMVKPLRHGVRLHAVIDACQSCPSLNLRCTARARRDGWSEWQDGAHGHQRQRQVQLPPDILQQGGVAPDLAEPESASFASGSGDAILLTSTGDDDLIDAQATMHLPSTGPMAFCLVQAVEQGQASTYNVLLRAIRYALKNGPQHFVHMPQLYSSRRLDFNEAVLL